MTGRAALRRTTFLLVGGAVALGMLALTAAIASLFATHNFRLNDALFAVVVPVGLVGLLPGIRELQVAGVRTLLGVDQAVVPEAMRWRHRWRTCVWTLLHQALGFLTGIALLLCIGVVLGAVTLTSGGGSPVIDSVVGRPYAAGTWVGIWAGALACVGVITGLVWLMGSVATWAAPFFLGPTGEDRLAVAEAKLRREQEHRRLSHSLHDGVGHALSAISLQAEAGRRHISADPDRAEAALGAIAALAGSAVAELDDALGILNEGATRRHPEADLAQLDALVEGHRALGIEVALHLHELGPLPGLASRTAYRICAEGLNNAAKHGASPVSLRVERDSQNLRVELSSALQRGHHRSRSGRGLDALRELVDVLGGSLSAGPVQDSWLLEARLPLGKRRG